MDVASTLRRATLDAGDIAGLLHSWLSREIALESERLVLWIPVALGLGIALYFQLPSEPDTFLGLIVPLLLVMFTTYRWITLDRRVDRIGIMAYVAVILICTGFLSANFRAHMVGQSTLKDDSVGWVQAKIIQVEPRIKDRRLTLELLSHELNSNVPEGLHTIRVTYRTKDTLLSAGDIIRLRVWLKPLPLPTYPGGFDFARHIYFLGVGATGFAISEAEIIETRRESSWSLFIAQLRETVYQRIRSQLPEENGAVAAALISGQKGSLSEATRVSLQYSGLAHILAISGLHIGIVAAGVFGLFQLAAALWPWLALRILPAHIGALCAIPATLFYMNLAGSTTPTVRATIMTVLALLALLLMRHPFSLRMIMVAACMIMLMWPDAVITASFQMSFAAVTALIAMLEYQGTGRRDVSPWQSFPYWPLYYLGMVFLTTIIASLATTFFVAWHFQRVPTYGILANLLAVPLTAFWIMPLGFLGLLAMPFELENVPLQMMGWGIDGLIAIATFAANLPLSSLAVTAPPLASFILALFGGLWFLIWRRTWRFWGLAVVALALLIWPFKPVPDILINDEATLVGLRTGDGDWAISPWKKEGFTRQNWLQGMGQTEQHDWPEPDGEFTGRLSARCDSAGCTYTRKGKLISLVRDAAALEQDCHRADLVIVLFSYADCSSGRAQTLPYWKIRKHGGMAIYVQDDGFEMVGVTDNRRDFSRPFTDE